MRAFICLILTMSATTGSARSPLSCASKTVQAQTPDQNPALVRQPSVLQIPVSMSLTDLFQRCENVLPTEIDESGNYIDAGKDSIGRLGVKYKVWRDPLKLSVSGNKLNMDAHAYYWIEVAQIVHKPKPLNGDVVKKLGSCGVSEPARQAEIGLSTEINFGADWNLIPKTTVREVSLLNRCTMTFLNLDQTNRIKTRLSQKLAEVAAVIDRRIAKLDLRARVENAWTRLQKPVSVGPNDKYLSISPSDISVSRLNGSGSTIQATVSITGLITFAWGLPPGPSAQEVKPLPPFKQSESQGSGLHLALSALLPFDVASEQLSRALAGREYSIRGNMVKILAAGLTARPDGVNIALDVTGWLKGRIYLRGKPVFDQSSKTLSLQDLDVAADTTDPTTMAAAQAVAGSPSFKAKLASSARWSLEKQIDQAKAEVNLALNRAISSDLRLKGSVTSLNFGKIDIVRAGSKVPGFGSGEIGKDTLAIEITADGTLEVEYGGS
jgi:hypothetical protein